MKITDTVRERERERESGNLNNVGVDDHIDPKKQTYNKYMSNVVGAGLDQPDIKKIKTGRSRPIPTRHKTKHSHYPNSPNNNNNCIINISRSNINNDNGRKWNNSKSSD